MGSQGEIVEELANNHLSLCQTTGWIPVLVRALTGYVSMESIIKLPIRWPLISDLQWYYQHVSSLFVPDMFANIQHRFGLWYVQFVLNCQDYPTQVKANYDFEFWYKVYSGCMMWKHIMARTHGLFTGPYNYLAALNKSPRIYAKQYLTKTKHKKWRNMVAFYVLDLFLELQIILERRYAISLTNGNLLRYLVYSPIRELLNLARYLNKMILNDHIISYYVYKPTVHSIPLIVLV